MCSAIKKPKLSDKKQDLLNRIIALENERDNLALRLSEIWELINNFRTAASLIVNDLTIEKDLLWEGYELLIKDFIQRTDRND